MARRNTETVDEYLAELGPVRRDAMTVVHNTILERLPDGYQKAMNYGMISYEIPLETISQDIQQKAASVCRAGVSEELHVAVPHERLKRQGHLNLVPR